MASVIKLVSKKNKTIEELIQLLKYDISQNPIEENIQNMGSTRVGILIFERYYHRVRCNITATIVITEYENKQNVDVICSGCAMIFNYGANDEFARAVSNTFLCENFKVVENF